LTTDGQPDRAPGTEPRDATAAHPTPANPGTANPAPANPGAASSAPANPAPPNPIPPNPGAASSAPPNPIAVNLVAMLGVLVLVALLVHPEVPAAGPVASAATGATSSGIRPAGADATAGAFAGSAPGGPAGTPPATRPVDPPPAPGTPQDPSPDADPHRYGGAAPVRVRIPDIGVDAPLEALHLLPDGALDAPRAWSDAGWYADGTRPGDIGPAVIAGHIDSTSGPAVFFRLDRLDPGALIEVERAGHWLSFRAVSVAEYPKNAFPSAAVYGPTPDPQLRLITCGGVFDHERGSYLDNIVVYAVAA
jgi:hypothetical protein